MATEIPKTRTARLQLENGTDSEGNKKYVNLSIANISASGWDGDKFLAVVSKLRECLSRTASDAQTTVVYSVKAS